MNYGSDQTDAATLPWTTRRLLDWTNSYFREREIESPRVCAELLLAHVFKCDRMRLYMEVDRPATPIELSQFRDLVRRVGNHEPVQFILGEWGFYGRMFEVQPCTLIPRPATESLVEQAVRHARGRESPSSIHVADIGTGSGCIAVTLALEIPHATVVATDIDAPSLDLAKRNALRYGVADRIEWRQGSLFEAFDEGDRGSFDIMCSNPPYISDDEWADVPRNVKNFEPERALRGGPDGLDLVRGLIERAGGFLRPHGRLLIEIADSQRDAVLALFQQAPELGEASVLRDTEQRWRVANAVRR